MKACLFALLALLVSPAFAQQRAPEISFDSVPDFLELPPGTNFGEVPGVAVNSKGHLFVFTRFDLDLNGGSPTTSPRAGRVVMTFGRRKESADEDTKPWEHVDPPLPSVDGLFRQPTDVAWDSSGNIYITDGYINSRVAKYDKNGD